MIQVRGIHSKVVVGGAFAFSAVLVWLLGWSALVAVVGGLVVFHAIRSLASAFRIAWVLRRVPAAPGGNKPFGHAFRLMNSTAWNVMCDWALQTPPLVKVHIGLRKMVLVGTAQGMKEVYQTKFRAFHKDLDFSFLPYLPILGTGLVTAHGEQWQKQRLLMAPTLRVDILSSVIRLTREAVDRLSLKIDAAKASNQPIEMEEEFRLMTLQIIGGAVLSLSPDECDQVLFQLQHSVVGHAV